MIIAFCYRWKEWRDKVATELRQSVSYSNYHVNRALPKCKLFMAKKELQRQSASCRTKTNCKLFLVATELRQNVTCKLFLVVKKLRKNVSYS